MEKRVVLIVLDSVGIGELPDAGQYGDKGSHTLAHVQEAVPEMVLPNLVSLGLSNIPGGETLKPAFKGPVKGCYGKMAEASKGKDTTTGHWEIAGLVLDKPFPTYPNGFPEDMLSKFQQLAGRGVLGNCTASGTEIIQRFGDRHVQTGDLIVYTSADSVFQIAAHEEVVPLEELFRICRETRKMLTGAHNISRVIARPFAGGDGNYTRTANRRDFSVEPLGATMLDVLTRNGYPVVGVGKIEDIFSGKGISHATHTHSNEEGMEATLSWMNRLEKGLLFVNLVDFDMLYGHRNAPQGYAKALMAFDKFLPQIIENLRQDDILMITADHGCDPTTASTDHSREYVPILVYGPACKQGEYLGVRESFADISATVLSYFSLANKLKGNGFLSRIK